MPASSEQALILGERVLDLRVAREDGTVHDPEPFRGLALRGEEIPYTVLGHDARGFLRERATQVLGAWRQFLHDSEDGIAARLRLIRRRWIDVGGSDHSSALVAFGRRQHVG